MGDQEKTINTKRFFVLNLPFFIRYIFAGHVLPLLLFFCLASLLFSLIFIFLLVIMMVYKFAFDILADTAKGNMKPNVRQNYLVTNVVAIKVAIIGLLTEGTLLWLKLNGYDGWYLVLQALFTFVTPAIYMILALTNRLFSAISPIGIMRLIMNMPLSYSAFVLLWISVLTMQDLVINPLIFNYLPSFINVMVSAFFEYGFLFLSFHVMGYILFQNRNVLDFEGIGFQRIDDDHLSVQTVVINPIYERIRQLLSDDDAEQALAMAIDLQKNGDNSTELQELSQQALQKKLYTPTNIDVAKKVHTYVNRKQLHKAFDVMRKHVDAGKDFVEESPADIQPLVRCAIEKNCSHYVIILVKDFHKKYLYHADIVPNYFLLAKVLYEDKSSREQSKAILQGLLKKHPHDQSISEVKEWLRGLELMAKNRKSDL